MSKLEVRWATRGAPPPPGRHVLARIAFHAAPARVPPPVDGVVLPLAALDTGHEPEAGDELWCVGDPVKRQCRDGLWVATSREYTFGCLQCPPPADEQYQTAIAALYERLLTELAGSRHPCPVKIWHYLPAINRGAGDDENYRRFCAGRDQALRAVAPHLMPLPAATAIGIPGDELPLTVYWLAAAHPGVNVENPRQTSAWRYPRQYGPVSPNFSRGTLLTGDGLFLISGTASVVEHSSRHPDDSAAQSVEMLANLGALLDAAGMGGRAAPGGLRIYLRDPSSWPVIARRLADSPWHNWPIRPLHGEICRAELMVELDGVACDASLPPTRQSATE